MAWKGPFPRNSPRGFSTKKGSQRHVVRFEKRGREFISVARLTVIRQGTTAKATSPQRFSREGRRMKMREVTGIIPETPRTTPGQGEPLRKEGGGPIALLRAMCSRDLGVGVKFRNSVLYFLGTKFLSLKTYVFKCCSLNTKSQSRGVIAGSSRNESKLSPVRDR